MSRSFGIDVAPIGDASIDIGLELLSRPPEWLVAIADLERLRADFEAIVPELASGALRLARCKFKRAHINTSGTWDSLCRLTIEDPSSGSQHDVDVHGTLVMPGVDEPPERPAGVGFATNEWRAYLPDIRWDFRLEAPDTGLAAMSPLTDPQRSRAMLEAALRQGGAGLGTLRIASCEPTVRRYREGRRCTIRYALGYKSEERDPRWPDGVIAKVYSGEEAGATHDAMRALWDSPLRTSSTVTIAEPLAFIPDLHTSVQSLVPGDHTLKEQVATSFGLGVGAGVDALSAPVRRAGRALAELHASNAVSGPTITWEDHVSEVRRASDHLSSLVPRLVEAIEPLVTRLEQLADETPAGPLVPTHRSFRPAQLLLDGHSMSLIDLDGLCQAEAGLDLALFRVTMVDLCMRALDAERGRVMDLAEQQSAQAELDELCSVFLDGYEEVGHVLRPRLALWDAVTGAKDILDCWRKVKFEHLARRIELLRVTLGTSAVSTPLPDPTRVQQSESSASSSSGTLAGIGCTGGASET